MDLSLRLFAGGIIYIYFLGIIGFIGDEDLSRFISRERIWDKRSEFGSWYELPDSAWKVSSFSR